MADIVIQFRGTIYENGYGQIAQKVMRDKSLHAMSKAIYAYLVSFAGQTRTAFPSVELMLDELGMSEEALLNVLESIQTEIRESIQRQEQRQEELVKEIAATREENKELRNLIGERLEDRDRKLMETLRALQQNAEQEKKKKSWWTWKK